jgi:hypothetical protein
MIMPYMAVSGHVLFCIRATVKKSLVFLLAFTAFIGLAACSPENQNSESSAASVTNYQVPTLPTIEGPIAEPGEMFIADVEAAQPESVASYGYGFEEYFISGFAAGSPYKIRVLVIRPSDRSQFSGHILVENNHAQNRPLVWRYTRDYNLSRGHAWISVSTTTGDDIELLRTQNPDRYASLQLSEEQVSDVYAQLALLLKSDNAIVPGVENVYLTAFSMAERPLPPYMDTHHAAFRLADGRPLYDGFFLPPSRTASGLGPLPDVDVPVIQINSQLEVEAIYVDAAVDYRKPDSDIPGRQYRLYEVAGMAHIDSRYTPPGTGQGANHPGVAEPCDNPLNRFPNDRLISTALDHLVRWVDFGIAPPHVDPISVIGGSGGQIELDVFGNAVGGVRHTYVDVPVATHTPANTGQAPVNCLVYGSQIPFSDEVLNRLYQNRADYARGVSSRLDELVRDGWLLEEFAQEFREEAAQFERLPAE